MQALLKAYLQVFSIIQQKETKNPLPNIFYGIEFEIYRFIILNPKQNNKELT